MLIAATCSSEAFAQPPSAPGDTSGTTTPSSDEPSPAARAVELGKLGREHYDRGEWELAHDAFARAESLVHSPVFVLHLGRCRARLGDVDGARALFRRVLDEALPAGAPAEWQKAHADAEAELSLLSPAPVPAEPPAALPAAPPLPPAAPLAGLDAPNGAGRGAFHAGIALLALGGASAVAGVVVGAMALDRSASARDACDDRRKAQSGAACNDLAADHESATELAHAATSLFAIGGAFAVTGLVLAIVGAPDDEEPHEGRPVAVVPVPSGLGVAVRF